jgi:hypothetical protein
MLELFDAHVAVAPRGLDCSSAQSLSGQILNPSARQTKSGTKVAPPARALSNAAVRRRTVYPSSRAQLEAQSVCGPPHQLAADCCRAVSFFIIPAMSEPLNVSFESPQSGWMSLRLRAGEREFVTVVAHRPYDSLRELLAALASLLEGADRAEVRWNAEPEEFDFVVSVEDDGAAHLSVKRHTSHDRRDDGAEVFGYRGTLRAVCAPFCAELQTLGERGETDEFERNWRRPFPSAELRRLCAALDERAG